VPFRSVLRTAVAALALSLLAAPAWAQDEFRYADIPWGIDARAATKALTAQGFEPSGGTTSEPGDLVFADVDNVLALALFAGDSLVGIGIAYVASRQAVEEMFQGSVEDAVRNLGEPAEREEGVATWRRGSTSFSITVGESEAGVHSITVQYGGPGYDAEIARRAAAQAPPGSR
jgi:hypothetical protein